MERLAQAFRDRRDDVVVNHPFEEFHLDDTVRVRPNIATFEMPLFPHFFKRMLREVGQSAEAGARIGSEWMPRTANAIRKRDEDDVWIRREDLRPLDDVCTKFCTLKYFPDAFSRLAVISNVVRLFHNLKQWNKATDVMFKGGVMQRLLILELVDDLPPSSRVSVIEYLKKHKALSISDLDFEVNTNSTSKTVQHRTAFMSFLTLVLLQHELNKELTGSVPARLLNHEWNKEEGRRELKERLQNEIETLPSSHPLHGATIDGVGMFPLPLPKGLPHKTRSGKSHPDPRKNRFIFQCGDDSCVGHADVILKEMGISMQHLQGVSPNPLYTNLNMYIGEDSKKAREGHLRSTFHLARIKHTFHMYYTTKTGEKRVDRLAGEIVDMSQGVPDDENHTLFFKRLPQPYREYKLLGGKRSVRSYSMLGFMLDIVHTIHHAEAEAWKANKLVKRQARYVAFYVGVLLETLSIPQCVRELERLEQALHQRSEKQPPFRHAASRLIFDYERHLVDRSKYMNGLLSSLRAWIRSLTSTTRTERIINDVHMYQMHKFVTPSAWYLQKK